MIVNKEQEYRSFIESLYETLKEAKTKWVDKESVDDPKEMWNEYVETIKDMIPILEYLLDKRPVYLIEARYGAEKYWHDVTAVIEEKMAAEDTWKLMVNNLTMGKDPAWGIPKYLMVTLKRNGRDETIVAAEGEYICYGNGNLYISTQE